MTEWKDARLKFKNLKTNRNLNTLTPTEKEIIWIPGVVFFDTETKAVSLNDEKAFATVTR